MLATDEQGTEESGPIPVKLWLLISASVLLWASAPAMSLSPSSSLSLALEAVASTFVSMSAFTPSSAQHSLSDELQQRLSRGLLHRHTKASFR